LGVPRKGGEIGGLGSAHKTDKNVYILFAKSLGKPKNRLEDNIKTNVE
jgi:hypothetical protein